MNPRRWLRGARRAAQLAASALRVVYLRLAYDGVSADFRTYIGAGCEIVAQPGGRIVLNGVFVGQGCRIVAGPKALIRFTPGNIVQPYCVIVARERITMDEGSGIAELSIMRDSDHLRGPDVPLIGGPHASSPIHIGRRVWLAAQVTILRGVTVGDDATVAAGSVVTRDVPPGALVGGIPAAPLTSRRPVAEIFQREQERTPL